MGSNNWNNNPPIRRLRKGEEVYDYLLEHDANPRRTSKGWSVRCLYPDHGDRNNSAIVFDDGIFACFGGCKRFSIQEAGDASVARPREYEYEPKVVRGTTDYFDYWLSLDALDEGIKGLPARHLNQMGWRSIDDNSQLAAKGGIFIPYFSVGRDKIMFYQIRHLEGDRRFSFLSGVTPIANGYEVLKDMHKYLPFTEGASDRAVLEYAGIPAIALPSASSTSILKAMAKYAKNNGLTLVACGDNDAAGDKLLSCLDGVSTYIDMRPPKPYKDYGEMFEAKGIDSIKSHLRMLRRRQAQEEDENKLKQESKTAWQIFYS